MPRMNPGIFRALAVAALVLFIAGDLSSVVSPVLKTIGTFTASSMKKTQPVRTESETESDDADPINILGKQIRLNKTYLKNCSCSFE